jgi:hypothetical protein
MFLEKCKIKSDLKKSRNDEFIKKHAITLDISPDNYKFGNINQDKQIPFKLGFNNDINGVSSYDIYDKRPYLKTRVGPMVSYNNRNSPYHVSKSTVSYIRDIVKQDSFILK